VVEELVPTHLSTPAAPAPAIGRIMLLVPPVLEGVPPAPEPTPPTVAPVPALADAPALFPPVLGSRRLEWSAGAEHPSESVVSAR
jgi:hypothetical protein